MFKSIFSWIYIALFLSSFNTLVFSKNSFSEIHQCLNALGAQNITLSNKKNETAQITITDFYMDHQSQSNQSEEPHFLFLTDTGAWKVNNPVFYNYAYSGDGLFDNNRFERSEGINNLLFFELNENSSLNFNSFSYKPGKTFATRFPSFETIIDIDKIVSKDAFIEKKTSKEITQVQNYLNLSQTSEELDAEQVIEWMENQKMTLIYPKMSTFVNSIPTPNVNNAPVQYFKEIITGYDHLCMSFYVDDYNEIFPDTDDIMDPFLNHFSGKERNAYFIEKDNRIDFLVDYLFEKHSLDKVNTTISFNDYLHAKCSNEWGYILTFPFPNKPLLFRHRSFDYDLTKQNFDSIKNNLESCKNLESEILIEKINSLVIYLDKIFAVYSENQDLYPISEFKKLKQSFDTLEWDGIPNEVMEELKPIITAHEQTKNIYPEDIVIFSELIQKLNEKFGS